MEHTNLFLFEDKVALDATYPDGKVTTIPGVAYSRASESENYSVLFNNKITNYLNNEFQKAYGIEVIDASIIDVHPDEQLQKTIDARVTALQNKQKAEAEQETAKVEAATALIKAQNEADIALTKAKAEAEANRIIGESITPGLIQMKEAEARLEHGWVEIQGAETVVTKE